MISGVDHVPLAPVPSWDVTPDGRLLLGEARRYRLLVLAPVGDTVWAFEVGELDEIRVVAYEVRIDEGRG